MQIRKGTIKGFHGQWMSGVGYLEIEDPELGMLQVACQNAPMVRALDACFGDVIGAGHMVDPKGSHVGREVFYSCDEFGILVAFTPVEDAPDEMVQMYEDDGRVH